MRERSISHMSKEAQEIIKELPTGLLRWYPFRKGAAVLYIGQEDDALCRMLSEDKGLRVTALMLTGVEAAAGQSFDYAVCVKAPESVTDPLKYVKIISDLLKEEGILLLGMNNRYGIRYFCGDRDPYTGRSFDGIEEYWRAYKDSADGFGGRMYARGEILEMIEEAGFSKHRIHSVLTDLDNPTFIYAEEFLPNEDLSNRVFPTYNSPETLFLDELPLYKGLMRNGLFHDMANAYLAECTKDGTLSDMLHVTSSVSRGDRDALITVIHDNGTVTKEAAYPEGRERLRKLVKNGSLLKDRGIRVLDAKLEDDIYTMPFIDMKNGQLYLRELFETDMDRFLETMDHFRDLILQSSSSHEGIYEPEPDEDPVKERKKKNRRHLDGEDTPTLLLDKCMFDMVPLNSFFIDGEFVFYDQEFCIENYPANVIIMRMITTFYAGSPELEKRLPRTELFKRYGLFEQQDRWRRPAAEFLSKLRNDKVLKDYNASLRAKPDIISMNRQRMNFSVDDYQRIFVDIFEYADTRKLILFGSGVYAKRFVDLYSEDYGVYAVVDNNEKRQGQEMEGLPGIRISSPALLDTLEHGEYKVLICIKNYLAVMKQLEERGIKEYSVFEVGKAYPRKRHPVPMPEDGERKKYHVGYIAGVFDLYHVGHLNMFKRAKEMCDYLIAGVVTDEGVKRFKGTEPFVPFEERIEMVRSCRYVDEAVAIPLMFRGTRDAWKLHHFDVQFSGSDYVNDPDWEENKSFLEKHGATLEFFPYTQSTSSTQLKKLIKEKLLIFEREDENGRQG